jgi:integrase
VKRSVAADLSRLKHLYETIGDVPVADFALAHAEKAMASLPESARSSSTRRQSGQVISRILKMAVYPLKLIEHSPLPEGFLPDKAPRPAFGFLYPDEDAQLLACEAVPLRMRLLYGFLAREGMRVSEALGLRWSDFDFRRGRVALDRNETERPRDWQLSPGVRHTTSAMLAKYERDDSDRDLGGMAAALRSAGPAPRGAPTGRPDSRRVNEFRGS